MVFISWFRRIIPIALVLALLVSTAAFAAGNNAGAEEAKRGFGKLRLALGERAKLCVDWQCVRAELSEEVKANINELRNKAAGGEITRQQFREEMKQLMPEGFEPGSERCPGRPGMRMELSDETKAKIEELRAKLDSGEITREQFREELKQLMPEGFEPWNKSCPGNPGKGMELSEEVRAKIEELRNKFEGGEITREQLREEMRQLKQERMENGKATSWRAVKNRKV